MARMPQIPQPEISGRPDSRVGGENLPTPESIERPFQEGAAAAGGMGDKLEVIQAQRDAALAKVNDVLDDTTAIDELGKHANKVTVGMDQLQKQFVNDPQKALDALREQLPTLTETAVQGAPNGNAALKMLPMFARENNKAIASMEDWVLGRGILNAKNKLKSADNEATRGLGSVVNGVSLDRIIRAKSAATAGIRGQLTKNAAESQKEFARSMVNAWVEQRSAANPQAALDVIGELKNQKGVAHKYGLDEDEIQHGLKLAQASYEGGQKSAAFDNFAAHHRSMSNLSDLLNSNDPGFPSAAYAERQKIAAQMDAYSKNPGLSAESKASIQKSGEEMLRSVDAAQDAFRKNRTLEQKDIDQNVRRDLLGRNVKIFTKGQVSLNTHYEDALRLRQDNLKALVDGRIPYQTYEVIETGLKKSLAVRDAIEAKNTGPKGFSFGGQSARQAGNERLNQLFAGAYKNATPEKQNDAREFYMRQLLDATVSGANVDNVAALKMAQMAADFAVGK